MQPLNASQDLRFVEKMYSFPDNLRNPSCKQERQRGSGTEAVSIKQFVY